MTAVEVCERGIVCSTEEVRGLLDGRVSVLVRPICLATLRVNLPRRVTSDPIWALVHAPIIAERGRYIATMNQYGAVSIDVHGEFLGVKPGEFNFLCPFVSGNTINTDNGKGMHPWTIVPPRIERRFVREAFLPNYFDVPSGRLCSRTAFRADWDGSAADVCREPPWRSATQMKREYSRLSVAIDSVCIQRVEDLGDEDAIATGIYKSARRDGTFWSDVSDAPSGEWWVDPLDAYRVRWNEQHGKRYPWASRPWAWVIRVCSADEMRGGAS